MLLSNEPGWGSTPRKRMSASLLESLGSLRGTGRLCRGTWLSSSMTTGNGCDDDVLCLFFVFVFCSPFLRTGKSAQLMFVFAHFAFVFLFMSDVVSLFCTHFHFSALVVFVFVFVFLFCAHFHFSALASLHSLCLCLRLHTLCLCFCLCLSLCLCFALTSISQGWRCLCLFLCSLPFLSTGKPAELGRISLHKARRCSVSQNGRGDDHHGGDHGHDGDHDHDGDGGHDQLKVAWQAFWLLTLFQVQS